MKLEFIRYFFFFTACTVFLGGCNKEQLLEDEGGGYSREMRAITVTTHLPRAIESGTSAEDGVQTLRLIAYEYNGTNYLAQKANTYYTAAEASAGNGTYQIRMEIPQGIAVRIFVVANEKAQWNLGDQAMSAYSLQNKIINHLEAGITLDIQPPFVMFSESETIESFNYQPQEVTLVRTVAKVSISLQAKFDQIVGLNGGSITISSAALKRLPNTQKVAPGFPFAGNEELDLSNTASKDFTFVPVVNAQNNVTGFTTEATRKLIFYLPEYTISNKNYYSFIQIEGQYTPLGSSSSIPITYRIPIGNGVQKLYNGSGILSVDQLLADDLTITRNNHYEFDATLQTLGETDGLLFYVKAQPWMEGETTEGVSPGAPYLNVSNIELTLTDTTFKRIYFWTNQPEKTVRVMPTIQDTANATRPLSDFFDITMLFANTQQTNGSIEISARMGIPAGQYVIYLNAGGLVRDIRITIHSTT